MTNTLTLTHKGWDDWNRPVYKCNGRLYVDVDPRKHMKPEICTKQNNEFYGEPCDPIAENIEIVFIPCRATW